MAGNCSTNIAAAQCLLADVPGDGSFAFRIEIKQASSAQRGRVRSKGNGLLATLCKPLGATVRREKH
jgi:hypothetical protein